MEDYRGKLNKVVTKIPLPGRDVSNLGADDYLYLDRSRALRDAAGVVNEFGQVFDGSKQPGSTDTLPGLFVVDGSAIPGAVAVNPTLTIAAQALKAVIKALP